MGLLEKIDIFKNASRKKVLLLGFSFIFILGSISTILVINSTRRENIFVLLQSARITASYINAQTISELNANEKDFSNPTYLHFKKLFTKINNCINDVRYIYVVGKKSDSLFFYFDTQPDVYKSDANAEPLAYPGEIYTEAPEEFYLAFENKREYVVGPYKDKWGSFISALIPVFGENNKVIAVLGIDMNTKRWNKKIFINSLAPIIITCLMALLLFLAVQFAGNRLRSEMTIRKINKGLEIKIKERTKELLLINEELKTQILERDKAEKALIQSEKRYRDFVNFLPQIVFEVDASGKILFVNQCAYQVMGYTADDLLSGVNIFQMIIKEDHEKAKLNIQKIIRREHNPVNEYMMVKKDGTEFPAFIYSSPVFENNKYMGLRGIAIDISYQRQVEELKRKTEIAENTARFKQLFLANMSHEMRTPMNGIINMTHFLLQTELNEKQKNYAQIISESSENLLTLINNILDLSKIEAGKMQLRPSIFNIHQINRKIKDLFDVLKKDKQIELFTAYDNKVPDYLFADENKIYQIMLNLVNNALKFTEQGFVKISISLLELIDNKIKVLVEVMDTGIGIPIEAQENLFKLFTQIDSTATRNYEGAGLGLAISRELSKLLGGEIGLNSAKGQGSTFWFTFMAELVAADDITNIQTGYPITQQYENLKALVAEDKDVNIKIMKLLLENIGCKTDIAYNGKEAIEKIEVGTYDIIFLDIQMPVMDGVTAIKILRKQHKNHLPPIIALTANAMEGDQEYYIEIGMDDYLSKPIDAKLLYEKINFWCREK